MSDGNGIERRKKMKEEVICGNLWRRWEEGGNVGGFVVAVRVVSSAWWRWPEHGSGGWRSWKGKREMKKD